jgi:hypothetical protein
MPWNTRSRKVRQSTDPSRERGREPARRHALLLLALSVAVGSFFGTRSPGAHLRARLFSGCELQKLSARGLAELTPEELAAASGLPAGTPLTGIEAREVEERLRAHPWILEARVGTLPPSRLLVEVTERRPVAVAALGGSRERVLVDAHGLPFAPARREHQARLPLLRVPEAPGEAAPSLREGLRIAALLEDQELPGLGELELGGPPEQGVSLKLRGEEARIVLGAEPFAPKLERLKRLREAGLAEAQGASSIDLRFADRAVLRSGPLPDGGEAAVLRGDAGRPEEGRSG